VLDSRRIHHAFKLSTEKGFVSSKTLTMCITHLSRRYLGFYLIEYILGVESGITDLVVTVQPCLQLLPEKRPSY
jgi:hypothetical protein